ncbi:MAG: hypothetical protein ABL933_02445 [Methyloglobulus sp.]|nr:hypothetical protein [Methyloglobulus sp.]
MSDKENLTCPACGSNSIETITLNKSIPVVYGNAAIFSESVDKCLICEEMGDFSNVNDENIQKALELARKESVIGMLDTISNIGIKMSYMERALDLPIRTIARWKNGEVSAASLALLRIIRTYPWLLEVADERFNKKIADLKILEEANHIIHKALESNTEHLQANFINQKYDMKVSVTYQSNQKFSEKSLKPKFESKSISISAT